MDDKKISFIYCTNNPVLYEESVRYVNSLSIPDGFEIEIISINDAVSITSGYNIAMKQSNAKYKVYMHQDVFIINKNFMHEIIEVFTKQPNLGMLGVIGAAKIPHHLVWWNASKKYGKVFENSTGQMRMLSYSEVESNIEKVEAIDGLIMITQVDIPWREDIFTGWHFYDISQCMEFTQAGYEIAIPHQKEPWIIHDCGELFLDSEYEKYKIIFTNEYGIGRIINSFTFYKFGKNSRVEAGATLTCTEGMSVGDNVTIPESSWFLLPYRNYKDGPRIFIEDSVTFGPRNNISAVNKVIVEKNVIFAPNVHVSDHNHEYRNIGIPIKHQGVDSLTNKVRIGEGSWIGFNAIIVGNVDIGKGCVVASNSTVVDDVPDYSLVAGNPAKVIKMFDKKSGEWLRVKTKEEIARVLENRLECEPLISICIPTYNRSACLDQCLRTIFNQIGDDNNFEVIVSNNNSVDSTDEIVKKYINRYSNIKYHKNEENIGSEKNILKTISLAKGTFCMIHGDDDYFKEGTLYHIYNQVNQHKQCGMFFLDVRRDNNNVYLGEGMNQYLRATSNYCTFISSLILKRVEINKIETIDRFLGTFINQVYIQFSILENNPFFGVINGRIYTYAHNVNGGYSFAKVFIENYLKILNYFNDKGLQSSSIAFEKKFMLDAWVIPSYTNMILNEWDQLDPSSFNRIFEENYSDEPYYNQAKSKIETFIQNKT
ncbi:glycosyltransferase [Paenibacillus sp. CGMCC 1.16610]|uniref:Glycosyltransferase n=1 Tax=Paenibacillus anseongense TaxID=2682845 RepID=A0ABW9U384_9BACL|nr:MULTISPECIES: glycosyltransferase [Paenibacillus]MBA2942398.1 glycosyltransferase [Paenibacillus sp. CGMCC 1.16610]MVQ34473.1 glycosyltransferase [Paenibacillus anseongense]